MKLKILLAALFVAGIATALAVAAPPPGKGNPHEQGTVSTTSSTSTPPSTTTTAGGKVPLCHKTGNGKFHAITVAKSAVAAHLRHGDYVGSDCSRATTTGTTSTATSTTTTCQKAAGSRAPFTFSRGPLQSCCTHSAVSRQGEPCAETAICATLQGSADVPPVRAHIAVRIF